MHKPFEYILRFAPSAKNAPGWPCIRRERKPCTRHLDPMQGNIPSLILPVRF